MMPRPRRIRSVNLASQPLQMAAEAEGFDSKVEHRDQIFQHIQDIFENQIEADVIHMVLAECDWEEEKSMDMLLSICQNCGPQTREVTEPDLALIACSLIDKPTESDVQSDLEVGAAASSLPIIPEPIPIDTNYNKHKLLIEDRQKDIKLCQNSPTDEVNMDLTSPFLTEDVKDITLQSYRSLYLNDLNPGVSSQNVPFPKDEDNTDGILKQSYGGQDVGDKTDCVLKSLSTQPRDSQEVNDKSNIVLKPLSVQLHNVLEVSDKTNTVLKPLSTHPIDGQDISDQTNCVLKPLLKQPHGGREITDQTGCVLKPLLKQSHDWQEVTDKNNSTLNPVSTQPCDEREISNKTNCVLKPLLTHFEDGVDNGDSVEDNRDSCLDTGVIDPVMNTPDENYNMCLPDNTNSDTIFLDAHKSSDTFFLDDETSVHNTLGKKSLKTRAKLNEACPTMEKNSERNKTSSVEKNDGGCLCTSEKLDENCSSPLEESEKMDVNISSSFEENSESNQPLSSSGTKVSVSDSCKSTKPFNYDEKHQSCKTLDVDNFKEDSVCEKSPDLSSLPNKTECEYECQKGSTFSVAHLSPDAPEFIPSFKTSSKKPYPFEGNPVFFTPKGPKHRYRKKKPPTCTPLLYPCQPGAVDHRHQLPANQIMLKPIPVGSVEIQSFPDISGKPSIDSTFQGKGSSKSDIVLSTSGNGIGTCSNEPLYSKAAIKNHNGPVVTSQTSSCSKETSVACSMAAEINRVKKYLDRAQLLMVILRGLPGSGKSTLAKELKFDGLVLTTDEYFMRNGHYEFDITMLSDAHAWTKTRTLEAMEKNITPLIIDNTNMQLWEMLPYVKLALKYNYRIEIIEPNTHWKGKPAELAKRNAHGVTKECIKKMKQRYEHGITVKSIIASLNKSEMIEKQRETEELRRNTNTNDLSLPSKKQSKEQQIHMPATLNTPRMCSSYTSLLKSQKESRGNLGSKPKRNSITKNKTKNTQRQTNVVQQLEDFPPIREKKSKNNTGNKDYQGCFEKSNIFQNEDYYRGFEKPSIQKEDHQGSLKDPNIQIDNTSSSFEEPNIKNQDYHNGFDKPDIVKNTDFQSGLQKSNIDQNKDCSPVPKKPKFGLKEKDEVISTLEDFLKHGDIKNMTDEDWQQTKEELDVLIQLSPVDSEERHEISLWLAYKMKLIRGFSSLSENESESYIGNRSQNIQGIKHLGSEDDNLSSVRYSTNDYNSGFQKSHLEHKFKNSHNSSDVQDSITSECEHGLNSITGDEIVSNLIDKRANNNKQDIPLEPVKTRTCLNVDNSANTNTNLSEFNLNSDCKHKEMKLSKQKNITSPLLDVSTFMDFSENKESMIGKKQEVCDKAIIFTENKESVHANRQEVSGEVMIVTETVPVSTGDNESCRVGVSRTNCDASLNIFLSEDDTEHTWNEKQSSPLSKEPSLMWNEDSNVSSSKPKRERRKKRTQVLDKLMSKSNVNIFNDPKSEISPVQKVEAEYWADSVVKNPVPEKSTVEEETVNWNLDCQKPKPQRQRRRSEQSIPSSENSSSEKLDIDNVEMLTEIEVEQQLVQPDDNDVMEIVQKDLLNTVGKKMDVKCNHVTSGDQMNTSNSETFINSFDSDNIEENQIILNEPDHNLVDDASSGVQENISECDYSHKESSQNLTMCVSTGTSVTTPVSDKSSQEPVILNKELLKNVKEANKSDDTAGSCFVTEENDERQEEPDTLNKVSMDDVVESPNSDSKEKISKKSKPRHKTGSMFSTPFLDSSAKHKFETLNWSCFAPTQSACSNVVNIEIKENKKVSCRTHWTLTTAKDFNVLDSLNNGFNVSSIKNADKYTILLGKSRSLNQNVTTKSKDGAADSISIKLPIDKSTMTDDFQNNVDQDIEFLKHSFPKMSEHQLCEVLTMCQNDVEWSVNLLLDWGDSVPLTSVDKQEIAEEMSKLKEITSPGKEGPQLDLSSPDQSSSSLSPLSLFDICYSLIKTKHLVNLKELEQHLIKDSCRRLQRMESHVMERILSISYDETLAEMDHFSDLQNETASYGSLSSSSSETNLLTSSVLSAGAATSEIFSTEVDELEKLVAGVELGSGQKVPVDDRIVLPVPRKLVEMLESLFGPAECRLEAEDEFEVLLDLDSAKLIHSCLQRRRMPSKNVQKQLMDDEALARRLQQEEKFGVVKPHYRHSGAFVIDVEPHYQRGGVSPVRQSKEPPVKFMDIMKEETDKHLLMEEQQRVLEESGNHVAIATKLKRQKLYHIFPGVDENFLEEIFQANGFSLEDTVCVIQNCLGVKDKERSVMVDDDAAEVDEMLLEHTKQQSRQTLIDYSLNLRNQSKEFQNVQDETDTLPSYTELRAEGNLHHQLRDDCFSKAQQAYRRGMKDVAYFYSQQGHLHTQKLKEAHMRASQKLLESRNELLEHQSTLDLHGFHVSEAISTLKNVLEQREIDFQFRPDRKKQSLVIVTGRGRHSQGGVAKVRPAVANFLNNAGYRFTENQVGVFKVQLRYRPTI